VNVQQAEQRATSLLWQLWWRGCDDDAMRNAVCLISGAQGKWTLGPDLEAQVKELLFRYHTQDRDRLERLVRTVDALKVLTSRERVLIAYARVTARERRFPYVRELIADIEVVAGPNIAPSERHIREILKQLKLPRDSRPGRPKKNRK
jgi:hypothetical protein